MPDFLSKDGSLFNKTIILLIMYVKQDIQWFIWYPDTKKMKKEEQPIFLRPGCLGWDTENLARAVH